MAIFGKKKKDTEKKGFHFADINKDEVIASAVLMVFACLTGLILNLADRKKAKARR